MVDKVAFGVIAFLLLVGALRVVTAKNLVHAVLWLGLTLTATALLFISLGAAFLAGIQLLLYTGGVITLMLFGVMLTRRHDTPQVENEGSPRRRIPGLLAGAALFGLLAMAIRSTDGLSNTDQEPIVGTEEIGRAFLTDHLLAFEVLSLLLLAAMIGAIVVARRRDHGLENVTPVPASAVAPAPAADADPKPDAAPDSGSDSTPAKEVA